MHTYSLGSESTLELVQGRGVRGGGLAHRREDLIQRCWRRHFENSQRSPNNVTAIRVF
jgi:hypothetical protein